MATGSAQGELGLVFRERPHGKSMESTCFHGSNVVRCEVISNGKQTPLVGA